MTTSEKKTSPPSLPPLPLPTYIKPQYELSWRFLQLPCRQRLKKLHEILDFYVVGEHNNKMLTYFLLLSNYSEEHMTLILYRGDSSGGKNHVVESVLPIFPEKDSYVYDSATAKVLNYDKALRGKRHLYLRELKYSEHEEVTEFIKSIANKGQRIHKEVVTEIGKSEHKKGGSTVGQSVITHYFDRLGIITTFSFENVQIDLVNRAWVLNPDQSHKQNERVIAFRLHCVKHLISRKVKERKEILPAIKVIQDSVRVLDFGVQVFIPFIDKIQGLFPRNYLNVRRDVDKIIHLIEIITIWNQFKRRTLEIDDERILFAEYEDLAVALEISQELFENLILHIDETKKLILDYFEGLRIIETKKEVITQLTLAGPYEFNDVNAKALEKVDEILGDSKKEEAAEYQKTTITEIFEFLRKRFSISRRTVKRRLDDLFYEGYLLREKEGNSFVYSKLRDYKVLEGVSFDEVEINAIVEQNYEFYKNMDIERIEGLYDAEMELGKEG